jgi:HSP20 family protein
MTAVNWNPWTELETFERALHRVFDLPLSRLFSNDDHEPWQPRTDVYETEVAYVIEADLPGVSMQDISVQLAGTTLVIAGKRESTMAGDSETHSRIERPCGTFRRTFTLPTAVKNDEVQAAYAHGVLSVTVPKADAARPRKIAIQAA